MKHAALLLIAAVGLAAAEQPKKDLPKKQQERLEGMWIIVASANEPGATPNYSKGVPVFEITADKFTFAVWKKDEKQLIKREESGDQAIYTTDTSKKPMAIDVTLQSGPSKGKVVKGIYLLKGDELTIALPEPGKERPTDFSPKKDVLVYSLKRAAAPAGAK